jgi:formylglycine-generating enzyme required for sulfatase activity
MEFFLFALILLSLSLSSFADRIPIAILNLDAKGVKPSVAGVVTESVRYEFSKQKDFDLVAREKMDQLAREKAIQLSGCTDISCAVQIGKALNVKRMVVGSVGKLGQKYLVFLRVVDVEKENVECSDKGEGEVRVEEIPSLVPSPVRRISACLTGKPIPAESTEVVGAHGGAPSSGEGAPAGMTFLRVNEQGYKEYKNEKDESVLIYIPAGEFTMGSNDYDDQKPIHTVYLDAYYIDKYEVTNAQYKKFCDATGHSQPSGPDFRGMTSYFTNYPNYPVVNVSWNDASSYASWAGKRLPTEAEWEKAARGTDGRKYPWGNTWDPSKCNNRESNSPDGYANTAPVGSFPQGASPYGVMDMAGNVWEWCTDWYDKDYYSQSPNNNPKGPSSGSDRVLRGGAWNNNQYLCRSTTRFNDNPPYGYYFNGFRCVR